MVFQCSVPGCSNDAGCKENLRMHGYPFHNDDILQQWLTAIQRKNWYPSKYSKVCSDHFVQNDYVALASPRLKFTAIPSRCLPIVCSHIADNLVSKFKEKGTQTGLRSKTTSSPSPEEIALKMKVKSLQRTVQRRNKEIDRLNDLLDKLEKSVQPRPNLIQNTNLQ